MIHSFNGILYNYRTKIKLQTIPTNLLIKYLCSDKIVYISTSFSDRYPGNDTTGIFIKGLSQGNTHQIPINNIFIFRLI